MTKKEKKVIFTIIAILVLIFVIVVLVNKSDDGGNNNNNNNNQNTIVENEEEEKYITELDDGTKLNNSADLEKAKTYKTVQISNIQVTSNTSGNTTILATVKNTGTTQFEREHVNLTLYGENGEVKATITATIPTTAPGETTQLNAMATADIANIKDFSISGK